MKSEDNTYSIVFKPSANKEFESLNKSDQIKIKNKIEILKTDPYPAGVKKLSTTDNIFRLRTGKFRVLYTIIKQKITIIILKVGHRRDVYKNI